MANRKSELTRVEYWSLYREEIKKDFLLSQKSDEVKKSKPVKEEKTEPALISVDRRLSKAEELLHEYETKLSKSDSNRKESNSLLVLLAIITFIIVIAGIIFVIWRYRS